MFLLNSRSSLVTATPTNPRRQSRVPPGHPFSRSYGVNLPSSLTRVISRALVSSTYPPVSVYGTVQNSLPRGFSRRTVHPLGIVFPRRFVLRQALCRVDLPARQPYARTRSTNPVLGFNIRVPPLVITRIPGTGISTSCPSPTLNASA